MRIPPVLPIAIAAGLCACHKQKPPPSIDAVTAALEHSAEQTLTAPTLANEQVVVPARPGEIDLQAAEIIESATAAGGVGIRTVDAEGRVSILATIPDNNADAFKAAVRHIKAPMEEPSATTSLIEVLIEKPAASGSPSPSP